MNLCIHTRREEVQEWMEHASVCRRRAWGRSGGSHPRITLTRTRERGDERPVLRRLDAAEGALAPMFGLPLNAGGGKALRPSPSWLGVGRPPPYPAHKWRFFVQAMAKGDLVVSSSPQKPQGEEKHGQE